MTEPVRSKSIVFIGDLTIDKYPDIGLTHPGGASLNGAMWAIRGGIAGVSVMGAVGKDKEGARFLTVMSRNNIRHDGVVGMPGRTSAIEIIVSASGIRRWGEWNPGVLADYHLGQKEFEIIRQHKAAVITIYGATKYLLTELSKWGETEIKRPLLAVNFDDLSQVGSSTDIVSANIEGIDAGFFGLEKDKDARLIDELGRLARNTGKLMVVTLGTYGAVAFDGQKTYESPAIPVAPEKIQDTTGAGDAFLAGFIVRYMTDQNIAPSLIAGNMLAAQKIQIRGAY